jgi:hypothetical protein
LVNEALASDDCSSATLSIRIGGRGGGGSSEEIGRASSRDIDKL